ncbi:MAG: DUF3575 domain-containing protein [Paludibacteraceae bacterium]|nr:DUF3575 domain-containing protein [Paludibacteraceae bacterium]
MLFSSPHLSAQDIALKNNLLYDIAATPNLSLENWRTCICATSSKCPFGTKTQRST